MEWSEVGVELIITFKTRRVDILILVLESRYTVFLYGLRLKELQNTSRMLQVSAEIKSKIWEPRQLTKTIGDEAKTGMK